jgi:4-amino-4-deoxy-L-arabinose transferase-like glycosyltransferase
MSGKSVAILVAALLIFAAGWRLREVRMAGPMRNDESFTAISYVIRGDYFDYTRPNNHILNTLLMAGASQVAGDSPQVLRSPAFICGLLLLPATGWFCWELCGSWAAALVAMALAASSTALIEYSVNARGYSLVALAAVVMGGLGVRLRARPGWKTGWALWALAGALGMFAVPTMMLAIVPLALMLLVDSWAEVRKRIVPLGVALVSMVLLTALFYAPVISRSGLAAITGNSFVAPMPVATIPSALDAAFAHTGADWTGRGTLIFFEFLILGSAVALSVAIKPAYRMQALAIAGVLLAVAAAFAQRRVAPPRAYLYVQPWMIACSCAAAAQIPGRSLRPILLAFALAISAYDGWRVKHQPLLISEDPHTFVEASRYAYELIQAGAFRGDTAILWSSSENIWPPLLYYMILFHPDESGSRNWNDPGVRQVFILVSRSDDVAALILARPTFSAIFGPPRLVQVTPNCEMYLVLRK